MARVTPAVKALYNFLKKELDHPNRWQNTLYCIQHKPSGQQLWIGGEGFLFFGLWPREVGDKIKFSKWQRFVLHRKSKRVMKFLKRQDADLADQVLANMSRLDEQARDKAQ